MRVQVDAGGRIHFGLIDLTGATPRAYGGIGAMLAEPQLRVSGIPSGSVRVSGLDHDVELRERVLRALRSLQESTGSASARLHVAHSLPRHHGLGSGTATILSCLVAMNAICDAGATEADLVQISGRGGASGTGVNGYWRGGLIVDCGREPQKTRLPSGAQQASSASLLVQRIAPPPWPIDVFLPERGVLISGATESRIFSRAARGSKRESLEALALLYHGLVPALLRGDLEEFGYHMREYQARGLKKYEIAFQDDSVRSLMDEMQSAYPCVAMSSMGPAVVGIRDLGTDAPRLDSGQSPAYTTWVDNEGARVTWKE